jgi:hypothetical protein
MFRFCKSLEQTPSLFQPAVSSLEAAWQRLQQWLFLCVRRLLSNSFWESARCSSFFIITGIITTIRRNRRRRPLALVVKSLTESSRQLTLAFTEFSWKWAAIHRGIEHGIAIVGAVTRKLPVKKLRAGKDLACALVVCKMCKWAMALELCVITGYIVWHVNPLLGYATEVT